MNPKKNSVVFWGSIVALCLTLPVQLWLCQKQNTCVASLLRIAQFTERLDQLGTSELSITTVRSLNPAIDQLADVSRINFLGTFLAKQDLDEVSFRYGELITVQSDMQKNADSGALSNVQRRHDLVKLSQCVDQVRGAVLNLLLRVQQYAQGLAIYPIWLVIALLMLERLKLRETPSRTNSVINDSLETTTAAQPGDSKNLSLELLNLMPVGVALVDATLKIIATNKSFKLITGWDHEESVGLDLTGLLADLETGKTFTDGATIFDRSLNSSLDVRLLCKNSDFKVAQLSLLWGSLEGQRILIANLLDITYEYRFGKLKEDVANMVSHDLGTPLASLRLMSEMLDGASYGILTEKGKRLITLMRREFDRLEQLVRDLLNLSNFKDGTVRLDLKQSNICELLADVFELSRPAADARSMTLSSSLPDEVVLRVDRARVMQVVLNLVSNAIRYCPEGALIRIDLETETAYVKIIVTDNGPGIPPSEHVRIFEQYYQATSHQSRPHEGRGLGLAICKLLIEAHGGRIGVDSEPGQGSKFWFTLPRDHSSKEDPDH